mgnify:CR=1 FL=1
MGVFLLLLIIVALSISLVSMQTTKKTEIVRDTVSASMRTDTRTEIQEKYFRMRMDLYLKKRYKKLIGWEFLDDKEVHFLSSCNRIMLHLREDDVAETVPSLAVWEDGYRRSEDEIPVDPEDNNNSTQEDNEVIKWITDNIGTIEKEIQKLLATADNGRLMKEGISTVIVGKPNAGKSSLLNMLLGEDRAIVTEIAGTTRDALHETINLHGISLNMIDTAGIHETQDVVEKIGVERAKKYAVEADLILYVVDASEILDEDDQNIIPLLEGKKAIILLNKSDLENKITEESLKETLEKVLEHTGEIQILRTSTIDPSSENSGMEELEETIRNMFFEGKLRHNNELVVTNLRHKEALQDALNSLQLVEQSIEDGMPEDFFTIDLMEAYQQLGLINGDTATEDLVNKIFEEFCMGK